MVVWICLPHIAATSSNGGSLFWVKTTTYFKSVSNYKGSSHHLHREVINISPPPCLPPHQQCSIATASSCRSLSTRYESPLKPFHFNGRAWQFIIHCIHCSTAATVQEVRAKMTIVTSILGCQGCIQLMRTAHLCLDICQPPELSSKTSRTHDTGIKDRASITTDFGIQVLFTYKMLWRNSFGNTLKYPRPISPGNEWWVALFTPHYTGHVTCKTATVSQLYRICVPNPPSNTDYLFRGRKTTNMEQLNLHSCQ